MSRGDEVVRREKCPANGRRANGGRKLEKTRGGGGRGRGGDIFTRAINLISRDARYTAQVGKFDLRAAINNTAETRFNYSPLAVSPPGRITDYFIVDHYTRRNDQLALVYSSCNCGVDLPRDSRQDRTARARSDFLTSPSRAELSSSLGVILQDTLIDASTA